MMGIEDQFHLVHDAHDLFHEIEDTIYNNFEDIIEMEKALASGQAGGDEGAEKKAAKSD